MEEVTPLKFNTFWSKSSPQHLALAPRTFTWMCHPCGKGSFLQTSLLLHGTLQLSCRTILPGKKKKKRQKGYAQQHTLTILKSSSSRLLCRALSSHTTCKNSSLHLPRNPLGLKGLKLVLTPSLFSLVFHYIKASLDFLRFVS